VPTRILHQRLSFGVSLGAFVVLFPLFYLYHYAVAGGVSPFLQGYTGRASLMCLFPLALAYWLSVEVDRRAFLVDIVFWGFLAFKLFWILLSSTYNAHQEVTQSYLGSIVIWACLYIIARLLPVGSRTAQIIFFLSQLTMLAVIFSGTSMGVFRIGAGDSVVTYQAFAVIYLITALLCLASIENPFLMWVQIAAATIGLFLIGARSELLALAIFAALMFGFVKNSAINLSVLMGGALLILYNINFIEGFSENRFYDLVVNMAAGTRMGRDLANELALQVLTTSPVIGEYASYPPGLYAHNILSVWVDFGLFGLLWFALLLSLPLLFAISKRRWLGRDRFFALSVALMITTVSMLMTVKVFTYLLVPFAVGFAASRLSRREFAQR